MTVYDTRDAVRPLFDERVVGDVGCTVEPFLRVRRIAARWSAILAGRLVPA